MSLRYYKNHYSGLPETKVLLYHSTDLDPKALSSLNAFSSLNRASYHVLITDCTVARIHLSRLMKCLEGLGLRVRPIVTQPGEKTKNMQTYVKLVEECAGLGIDRKSAVISFGGGVVKDLAGFLASSMFRGLRLVHIPTTMLAQVDAAIDCNQSVNLPHGKNLVGTWYSPSEVWVNTAFLQSLDERWIRDGLSESVKIALSHTPEFLHLLGEAAVTDMSWLTRVVDISVSLKTENMKGKSKSEEAVKHYGHAVGHAVEHLSAGTLGHGESIAIGMCVTAELASLVGLSDSITLQKHYDIFQKLALPTRVPSSQDASQIMCQIRFDKLFLEGKMYAAVLKSLGSFAIAEGGNYMHAFSPDKVLCALERNKNRPEGGLVGSKL